MIHFSAVALAIIYTGGALTSSFALTWLVARRAQSRLAAVSR